MKNSEEIQCYTQDEIKELLDKKERLVFTKVFSFITNLLHLLHGYYNKGFVCCQYAY